MKFDFSDQDIRKRMRRFEKNVKIIVSGVLDAAKDAGNLISELSAQDAYEDAEFSSAQEMPEEYAAPEADVGGAQDRESRIRAFLDMHAQVNEQWIRHLEERMDSILLRALSDMLKEADNPDAERFASAENLLRKAVKDCISKREALDQMLDNEFGQDALSLEGMDSLPRRITRKSNYEPMYHLMKDLTQGVPGKETAQRLKDRRTRLKKLIDDLPATWKEDLISQYPVFKQLEQSAKEEAE